MFQLSIRILERVKHLLHLGAGPGPRPNPCLSPGSDQGPDTKGIKLFHFLYKLRLR